MVFVCLLQFPAQQAGAGCAAATYEELRAAVMVSDYVIIDIPTGNSKGFIYA